MSDSIDHKATSAPVCPYCGYEMRDAWELDSGTEKVECEKCYKPYEVIVEYTATYWTEAIITNNEVLP
jgi:hypothetical protein